MMVEYDENADGSEFGMKNLIAGASYGGGVPVDGCGSYM